MASYTTKDIRNVVLAGHSDAGKTTLAEALLFAAGATSRQGTVQDGTTVADYDVEEKERGHSIDTAIMHLDRGGRRLNILDTPGRPDFIGHTLEALSAVETVAIVVNASSGLGVNTRRVWLEAERAGLGRIVVVSKMDLENIDLDALLADLRKSFGERIIPANLPLGHGPDFKGVVPTLTLPAEIPPEVADEAAQVHESIMEAVIEADDQLLERYLGGEEISAEELSVGVAAAIREGTVVPLLFVSAEKGVGVIELLDFLAVALPSPEGKIVRGVLDGAEGDEPKEKNADSPFCAQVFKIMTDDYVGKISFIRAYSGELAAESTVLNPQTGRSEKVKEVFLMQGKDQEAVPKLIAGDIGAVTKVESLEIGHTICADSDVCRIVPPAFPRPMVAVAVEPRSRGDEGKIGTSLGRLTEEDPTFSQERRSDTRQLVISGMSTLHLNVILSRLKRRFNVEVDTAQPRISYRETITGKGDAKYRHKKQTGGAGQFAEVHMRIEPRERGEGFEFENKVVGGNIPGQFIPSCEKGVRSVLENGVIAGYPVVDLKATVYDGKHHPVDSKDIAFQIAARNAFKESFTQAKPVLLEPIMNVEILVPPEKLGDISGDLNSRRGRILGMDMVAGMQVIRAQVPEAELLSYAADLQSMTGGEGSYSVELSHRDLVPSHLTDRIVAASAKEKEEHD
ncbi:MAG: elongation factor G [Planctomycetota bacterium]|jgi:elongation factor G